MTRSSPRKDRFKWNDASVVEDAYPKYETRVPGRPGRRLVRQPGDAEQMRLGESRPCCRQYRSETQYRLLRSYEALLRSELVT